MVSMERVGERDALRVLLAKELLLALVGARLSCGLCSLMGWVMMPFAITQLLCSVEFEGADGMVNRVDS
jgi:hypothetical protein